MIKLGEKITLKELMSQNWYNNPIAEAKAQKLGKTLRIDEDVHPVWKFPVKNRQVTSPFGHRTLPNGLSHFHNGTDYTGINQEFAYAIGRCFVTKILKPDYEYPCRFKWENGRFVDANVPAGRAWTPYVELTSSYTRDLKFVYRHGDTNLIIGDELNAGDVVITVGDYGYSMGKHLHLEIVYLNTYLDPDKWLKGKEL